jgi:hypothetical protein
MFTTDFPTDLQYELNQEREDDSYSQIRARIASRNKDIDILYKSGSSKHEISYITGIHPYFVEARVAELERDEAERREFLQTGQMPSSGGYLAIFP